MELIEKFVTGSTVADIRIDRMLATVLMTDIVGSTHDVGTRVREDSAP